MIGDADETAFVGELARKRLLKQMASATQYQGGLKYIYIYNIYIYIYIYSHYHPTSKSSKETRSFNHTTAQVWAIAQLPSGSGSPPHDHVGHDQRANLGNPKFAALFG